MVHSRVDKWSTFRIFGGRCGPLIDPRLLFFIFVFCSSHFPCRKKKNVDHLLTKQRVNCGLLIDPTAINVYVYIYIHIHTYIYIYTFLCMYM